MIVAAIEYYAFACGVRAPQEFAARQRETRPDCARMALQRTGDASWRPAMLAIAQHARDGNQLGPQHVHASG